MHFWWFMVLLVVLLMPAPPLRACETNPDPAAFRLEATADFQLLANDLLLVTYTDQHTGLPTHATLHRIEAIVQAEEVRDFTPGAVPVTLYTSDRTDGAVTYAAHAHPLFYGGELDGDGFPTRLWEDPQEDGLNGNEIALAGQSKSDVSRLFDELAL